MDMPAESKKQQAYRKASDQFQRAAERENTFRNEQAKAKAADAAKIAKLRGLRLAKEAADREAAEAALASGDSITAASATPARAKRRVQKISISS